jgi:hypothetical protein
MFRETWDDGKHVQNTLLIQALESSDGTKMPNLAVAERLAKIDVLKLPAPVDKSQAGMFRRNRDMQRKRESERESQRKKRQAVLESTRKRLERLTAPARLKELSDKFDLSEAATDQEYDFASESNEPGEFTVLDLAKYLEGLQESE